MAYADKEREKEVKTAWRLANQDRVKAAQERYNEKRRQARLDPEFLGKEAARKRARRRKMTDEEYAVYEQQQQADLRKYRREWAKEHYQERIRKQKERMAADPEYAAKLKDQWTRANAKRRQNGKPAYNESPEARERRLQRDRERRARDARDRKLMADLIPIQKPAPQKLMPPPPPKPKMPTIKKMGRFAALSKWHGL